MLLCYLTQNGVLMQSALTLRVVLALAQTSLVQEDVVFHALFSFLSSFLVGEANAMVTRRKIRRRERAIAGCKQLASQLPRDWALTRSDVSCRGGVTRREGVGGRRAARAPSVGSPHRVTAEATRAHPAIHQGRSS